MELSLEVFSIWTTVIILLTDTSDIAFNALIFISEHFADHLILNI